MTTFPFSLKAHPHLATLRHWLRLRPARGHFHIGDGWLAAYLSLLLGVLSLAGVLAFHFPAHLTIPELRANYDLPALRAGLGTLMILSGVFGVLALMRKRLMIAGAGLGVLALAALLGGADTPLGPIEASSVYVGLDWFVLGLLSTGFVFTLLEKAAPLREDQPVLRENWSLDLKHFFVMHLLLGAYLAGTNFLLVQGLGWARFDVITDFISGLPFIVQFFAIMLAVDLVEYVVHRAYHSHQALWGIHAVHHSSRTMDWLASSRLHVLEALITRTATLAPIFLLGFDQAVVNAYALMIGFHATFIHANIDWDLRWLEPVFVTPRHHHWHHALEESAHNKNFAVHFSFIDRLFGTLHMPSGWPAEYGIGAEEPAHSYRAHTLHPFKGLITV
ncbi:sterol desaturase family protein [Maricaulis sp.]|uniref:sterol desaturase family protein n=1 Tax=Maricaulis sp. TaxID=1486257 RepID=UPI003A8CB2D6